MRKVVVITGASKGIGRATAKKFSKEGYIVYDLSRTGVSDNVCNHIDCDISDFNQVNLAIEKIIQKEDRIDIAISNAGFGISGSMEACDYDMIKKQIDVNFTGSSFFAKCVLKYIRKSQGRILFMSSVAAVVPIPFQSLYSATKSAILTLAIALDNELKGSKARSIALMPGDLSTNFTSSRIKTKNEDVFYADRVERSVSRMEKDEMSGKTPEYIAQKLYKLATSKNPSCVNSVGIIYKFATLLSKVMPNRLKNWIIWNMYSK